MILYLLEMLFKDIFSVHSILFVDMGGIGSLLSGIGAIILAVLGITTFIYGPYLMKRGRIEKRIEKLSDISEEALNDLDSFKDEILNWLKYVNSWIVYNKNSEANKKKYISLSFEEQKQFKINLDDDK